MTDSTASLRSARVGARRLAATAAFIGVVCGSIGVAVVSDEAGAADIVYVSSSGNDGAAGGATNPVRTIEQAVRLARPGDTVEIAAGTYHESVQVYSKEVHLTAAAGAEVVLDGARVVDGWSASEGRWTAPWATRFERAGVPFTRADTPQAGWPEQFFLDGTPLAEVATIDALRSGAFFYDIDADRVVIADDPTGRLVEGSDLPWGIYLNEADGSSLDGLTVRRYATMNRNMAAIRAYADDLTITDLTVELNARMGVSVIGDRITLADVRSIDNGHLGVHGHRSTDVAMTDLVITGNNRERFDAAHSAGGVKVTNSTRLTFDSLLVTDNGGPGIWTDLNVSDVLIARSTVERNARSGIEIELSDEVIVFDNVVVDNGEAGVWVLESSDVEVWHNTTLGNVRDVWVLDGDRADLIGVTVVNNVLGGGAAGAPALLNVDDWTERRAAGQMNVRATSNRYWLRPGSPTTLVSRWANWPQPLSLSATIESHRSATGQGADSDLVSSPQNPFARSESDVRQPLDAPVGVPIPAWVAEVVGVSGSYPEGAITTIGKDGSAPDEPDDPTTTVPGGNGDGGGGGSGDPGSTSTVVPNRVIPPPGSVPDGVEQAQIVRSGQGSADVAAPAAPNAPVDSAQDCGDQALAIDSDRSADRSCTASADTPSAAPNEADSTAATTSTTSTPSTTVPAPTTTIAANTVITTTAATEPVAERKPRASGWGAVRDYVERALSRFAELHDRASTSKQPSL